MKKIICMLSIVGFFVSHAFASVCIDLPNNVSRYQENQSVLTVQNFLFEKGFLTVVPNGYFGNGTFKAVKAYQKSVGLSQVGVVGPGTRASIKQATCAVSNTGGTALPATTPTVVASPVIVPQAQAPTLSELRNIKRKEDVKSLLLALYSYYLSSRTVYPSVASGTPVKLCTTPKITGTTTEGWVSPCASYANVTELEPIYISKLPYDPSITNGGILTGYSVSRTATNEVTVHAESAENKEVIKATCNFNYFCQDIKTVSAVVYEQPKIAKITRNYFLRDATSSIPVTVTGTGFSDDNSIILFSAYNSKEYFLGKASSTGNGTSLVIDNELFNKVFPCSYGCDPKIPFGDYSLLVRNKGGDSNGMPFAVRGYTTSSLSTRNSGPVIPGLLEVKVATISVSAPMNLNIKSLTLTGTSTSKSTIAKIKKFTIKDQMVPTSIFSAPSGSIGFSKESIVTNQSKIYDVYIDVDQIFTVEDSGFVTYNGKFLLSDPVQSIDFEVPIKPFSFTISLF